MGTFVTSKKEAEFDVGLRSLTYFGRQETRLLIESWGGERLLDRVDDSSTLLTA